MTMLTKLNRSALLMSALAIALLVFAACSNAAATPTAIPTATPDAMMHDDDAMMDGSATPDAMMDGDAMHDDGMMYPDGEAKSLVTGWYRDQQVKYYDFGMNSATNDSNVATAPIYVFIHGFDSNGNPMLVEGQHNVVNVQPGEPGYSDLWQVNFVTVPDDYVADSITSVDEAMSMGYNITATQMFVNCPIVDEGTTLEGGEPLVQGWHKGEKVFYPDFGVNIAAAIPIWVFATGVNADGSPQLVEGQSNVIDAVPGDPGYSAFWRVNLVIVDGAYVPNSVTSRVDIEAMGYDVMETGLVVNCPVTVYPGA